jgi:hypothetical protein
MDITGPRGADGWTSDAWLLFFVLFLLHRAGLQDWPFFFFLFFLLLFLLHLTFLFLRIIFYIAFLLNVLATLSLVGPMFVDRTSRSL